MIYLCQECQQMKDDDLVIGHQDDHTGELVCQDCVDREQERMELDVEFGQMFKVPRHKRSYLNEV